MKNKKIADFSIIALTLLVIIITLIKIYFGNNEYFEIIGFITEAALVGSIADWFAITALFEKPFLVGKLPIIASNTNIISKNREIIVNSVAYMVQNELLSEKILRDKIEKINIIEGLITLVDKNINTKTKFYEIVVDNLIEKLQSIDTLKFSGFLENYLKQKIEIIDISVYLNKGISYAVESDEFKEIFNTILDSTIVYVNDANTKVMLQKLANDLLQKEANSMVMEKIIGILKSVNAINTSDITTSLLKQINTLLRNLKNENDLLRRKLIEEIKQSFEKMHTDITFRDDIEKWKIKALNNISLQDDLNVIIKELIKVVTKKEILLLKAPLDYYNKFESDLLYKQRITSVIFLIKTYIEKGWSDFKNDNINKKNIDNFIKKSAFKIIESRYDKVGNIVKQVLNNMDDKALNKFVEQKAGNELHGIRINGCVVGALFGGFVLIATHLIYDLILPNLFNIKF